MHAAGNECSREEMSKKNSPAHLSLSHSGLKFGMGPELASISGISAKTASPYGEI